VNPKLLLFLPSLVASKSYRRFSATGGLPKYCFLFDLNSSFRKLALKAKRIVNLRKPFLGRRSSASSAR
jgi:hypothetical protein